VPGGVHGHVRVPAGKCRSQSRLRGCALEARETALGWPPAFPLFLAQHCTSQGIAQPSAALRHSLLVPVQGAGRTFHAFDPQRTGRITLEFSQFVYACSSVF
jgi:hypothetical protein